MSSRDPFMLIRRLLPALVVGLALHAEPARTLTFFGDSLTAGYGLDDPDTQSYPARIQAKIRAAGLPWEVVNAGVSGDTSAGGVRRVAWALRRPPDIFFLALGANDGLRGIAPAVTRANLDAIVDQVHALDSKAQIIVAGMQLPESLGPDYVHAFAAVFPEVATSRHALLLPFLLEGVGGLPALNQADGIHPNEKGAEVVADRVWKTLAPLLKAYQPRH